MSLLNFETCRLPPSSEENHLPNCFVCGALLAGLKELQRHLLRSHASQHYCLFCVEQKSWSDEFLSQAAYHAHYHAQHSGLVEQRRRQRQEAKREAAERRRAEVEKNRKRSAHAKLLQGKI